jgi:ABC-2 type transport system ATP-binding protein
VAIVAALASDVELLILDEPTSGLDPLMEAVFQEEIAREKAHGRSILLSSHIMSEVEALADRISIIRDGVVVESGTLDQMRQRTRTTISAVLERIPAGLSHVSGVSNIHQEGERWVCQVEPDAINTAMAVLTSSGITSLTVAPPSLSDLFLAHYDERRAEVSA